MNLNALANSATRAVTPNYIGTWRSSLGVVKNADFSRTPTYTDTPGLTMQVQPLSPDDLKMVDALNIQEINRAVYVNARLQGVNRSAMKGGDRLSIPSGLTPGAAMDDWLVKGMLEPWDAAGWTKVAVTLQVPTS